MNQINELKLKIVEMQEQLKFEKRSLRRVLGKRVRLLRDRKKMSGPKLASRTGKSKAYIVALEKGESRVTTELLIELCDFFEVSADYLLGLDTVPHKGVLLTIPANSGKKGIIDIPIEDGEEVLLIHQDTQGNLVTLVKESDGSYFVSSPFRGFTTGKNYQKAVKDYISCIKECSIE